MLGGKFTRIASPKSSSRRGGRKCSTPGGDARSRPTATRRAKPNPISRFVRVADGGNRMAPRSTAKRIAMCLAIAATLCVSLPARADLVYGHVFANGQVQSRKPFKVKDSNNNF